MTRLLAILLILLLLAAWADEDSNPCLHPRTLSGRLHPSWTGRCRMREVCEDCGKVMRNFDHGVQVRAASLPLASVVSRLSLPRILRGCATVSSLLWSPASPGLPIPLLRNGTEYYVCDGARNVVELRDAQGAVTDTYAYSPFGACVHAGPSDTPVRFSSEIYDPETGLVHYRFREYSPALGRWLSPDPAGHDASQNLYAFAGNNPVNFNDALGLVLFAIDGTGNDRSHATNVQRFMYLYADGPVYYLPGVGSKERVYDSRDRKRDQRLRRRGEVMGHGAISIQNGCIRKICDLFCADSNVKIDIVGFSRGAAIAKEIAEALHDEGCCCNGMERDTRLFTRGKKQIVNVRFLGLFDPVYSMPYFIDEDFITDNVEHANIILAKDENRYMFKPANFANTNDPRHRVVSSPGIHSDVGGFYTNNDIYAATLRDMVMQAHKAGVKMNLKSRDRVGNNFTPNSNRAEGNPTSLWTLWGTRSFKPSIMPIDLSPDPDY